MKKHNCFAIILVSLAILAIFSTACNQGSLESKYKLWYEQPAKDWMTEALPIGNGDIGAMIFGSVPEERIQITEKSLWFGGPGSNPEYNGGNRPGAYKALPEVRKLLSKEEYTEAQRLAS